MGTSSPAETPTTHASLTDEAVLAVFRERQPVSPMGLIKDLEHAGIGASLVDRYRHVLDMIGRDLLKLNEGKLFVRPAAIPEAHASLTDETGKAAPRFLVAGDKLTAVHRTSRTMFPSLLVFTVVSVRKSARWHLLTLDDKTTIRQWLHDGSFKDLVGRRWDFHAYTPADEELIHKVETAREVLREVLRDESKLLRLTADGLDRVLAALTAGADPEL